MPTAIVVPESGPLGIDIWLTCYDQIDDAHLPALRLLLSPEERGRETGFYFADDQKRYLVTRAMVRTLLSRYATTAPERWVFSKNAYGRPTIAQVVLDADERARNLCFNISHTRGLIALAVTRGRELGIDVENIATRRVSLDIAKRFFSATEAAELSRVPPDRQQDRFFEYWTFKEAYIKARGMGLSLPLDGFSFQFPRPDAVAISIDSRLHDAADRWSLWQFRPAPDYLMAICADSSGTSRPAVSLRTFTPPADEMSLAVPVLRSSGSR